MKIKYLLHIIFLLPFLLMMNACKEEEYVVPEGVKNLTNDVIKRSLGPNMVGSDINFAYAMALPPANGHIVSAQVEATIAGAEGTFLENKSYYTTLEGGEDRAIEVAEPALTEGTRSVVSAFIMDTSALTLRYKYVIPEEARGKSVSFRFSSTSSNGETAEYAMGPYQISNMDMILDLDVSDGNKCYISIADMAVYNAAEAAAHADKIDLVYLFRIISPEVRFLHSFVSPAADPQYRPGITLPAGVSNSSKIRKAWDLRDQQLARLQFGVFIDDLDFQVLNLDNAPNYAINVQPEAGMWVETADGRYRAYVYLNSGTFAGTGKISIKRFAL